MNEAPDIRPMLETDIPQVLRIENLVFQPPWPEEAFQEVGCSRSWVICEAGNLRGYIMYHVVPDEAVIINYAIDPDHWRMGLGTRLLNCTLDLMKDAGINTIFLDVRRSNLGALKLYEKYGFVPMGVRRNYYSEPVEDAILMMRPSDG